MDVFCIFCKPHGDSLTGLWNSGVVRVQPAPHFHLSPFSPFCAESAMELFLKLYLARALSWSVFFCCNRIPMAQEFVKAEVCLAHGPGGWKSTRLYCTAVKSITPWLTAEGERGGVGWEEGREGRDTKHQRAVGPCSPYRDCQHSVQLCSAL